MMLRKDCRTTTQTTHQDKDKTTNDSGLMSGCLLEWLGTVCNVCPQDML